MLRPWGATVTQEFRVNICCVGSSALCQFSMRSRCVVCDKQRQNRRLAAVIVSSTARLEVVHALHIELSSRVEEHCLLSRSNAIVRIMPAFKTVNGAIDAHCWA